MNSPSHQICKLQTGPTELVIGPDTEIMQRHPRCQSSSQTPDLMGPLLPQAEGVKQLVVDRLYDLTNAGDPAFRPLGQGFLESRLGGWMTSAP